MMRNSYISLLIATLSLIISSFSVLAQERAAKKENLYLHLAKEFYMPGEILWFRIYPYVSDNGSYAAQTGSNVAYVEVLNSQQVQILAAKIALGTAKSNSGSFYIPAGISSGVYRLRAYTSPMKGEARFFETTFEILNPYLPAEVPMMLSLQPRDQSEHETGKKTWAGDADLQQGIQLDLPKETYNKRERIDLNIQTQLPSVSIAVYKVDALQHPPKQAQSSLSGLFIGEQEGRFGNEALPEIRYHRMVFRLSEKISGLPIVNEVVFLSLPGKTSQLFASTSNDQGEVTFYVKDVVGSTALAIRLKNSRDMDVELISPFMQSSQKQQDVARQALEEISPAQHELILSHSLDVQIENSYFNKQRAQIDSPKTDALPFYGKAEVVYRLDDYTRFVLMEEVLKEYIWEIKVNKTRSAVNLRVMDQATGTFYNGPPLILLDGVPLSSANEIINYDPLKIEKISVVTNRYLLGDTVYDGIIEFSTYDGLMEDFPLESAITLIQYGGLQPTRVFFAPQHLGLAKLDSRLPDTRNLLHWDPAVPLNEEGMAGLSFFTSDITGQFIIVVEGVSPSGAFGSTTRRFTVADR